LYLDDASGAGIDGASDATTDNDAYGAIKGSASGAGIDGACGTITDDDASGVGIDGTSGITTDDDLGINLGHQAVSDLQKGTP
jgi:hypothetical protein